MYSLSQRLGFLLFKGNVARLGVIDDREERTNLTILGVAVSTLMIVSHLFPKISEGNGKAGWFLRNLVVRVVCVGVGDDSGTKLRGKISRWVY